MKITSIFKEARAIGRQVSLLLEDRGETFTAGRKPIVIFLHGLYATAGEFRLLRSECEKNLGLATAAFNHAPGISISQLAHRSVEFIERIAEGDDYFLVGHSLGALAWAYAHQHSLLSENCKGTLALAAPLYGTTLPQLAPARVRAELGTDSPLLQRLQTDLLHLPIHWIIAADDLLARSWPKRIENSLASKASIIRWDDVGHNEILFDPRSQVLLRRLLTPLVKRLT